MICEDDEGTTTQEVIEFGDGPFYRICLAFSCWPVALRRVKGVWGHCYYFLLAVFILLYENGPTCDIAGVSGEGKEGKYDDMFVREATVSRASE